MTDIVERLRFMVSIPGPFQCTALNAADEIERLRANEAAAIFAFRETNDIALEEIKRLQADIDKLVSERDGWLQEIDEWKQK